MIYKQFSRIFEKENKHMANYWIVKSIICLNIKQVVFGL